MDIKIERGISIPKRGGPHDGKWRSLPWDKLKVGESFVIPFAQSTTEIGRPRLDAQYRTGFVFKSAKCAEGVRIWRIA